MDFASTYTNFIIWIKIFFLSQRDMEQLPKADILQNSLAIVKLNLCSPDNLKLFCPWIFVQQCCTSLLPTQILFLPSLSVSLRVWQSKSLSRWLGMIPAIKNGGAFLQLHWNFNFVILFWNTRPDSPLPCVLWSNLRLGTLSSILVYDQGVQSTI